jgi:transposase
MPKRKPYASNVTDEEWVFDALRWIVRSGASWRMLPHDFPPWEAVYQQTQWWIAADVFEAMAHDVRALLRLAQGRAPAAPRGRCSTAARCA